MTSDPEVIKLFPCSTQLSTKLILLINVKMSTIVDGPYFQYFQYACYVYIMNPETLFHWKQAGNERCYNVR